MKTLNFRPNNQLIRILDFLLAIIIIITAGNFFCAPANSSDINPADETISILERWTSAHWGQDCFVWLVHYPEELVKTWVEAEAMRSGMSDSEQERFQRNFISELKLDTSETFLLSIYSFGARPVNLSPVRDNISLLSDSGERIKPSKYDSTLDSPSAGVVQGLVFFPKQNNKDYVIAIKGISRNERIFSFSQPEYNLPAKEEKKPDVVVVNLPKRPPRKKLEPPKEEITPPLPMIPAKPLPQIFNEDSKDMAEFVKSVQERGNNAQKEEDNAPSKAAGNIAAKQSNINNAYVSRENVLRKFLLLWSNNNPGEMYEMLSDSSKKQISLENFAKQVAKDSAFRSGLKDDYRIDWIGEERAKVITTHKTLVFKSVVTRTLGITREGSSWKVLW